MYHPLITRSDKFFVFAIIYRKKKFLSRYLTREILYVLLFAPSSNFSRLGPEADEEDGISGKLCRIKRGKISVFSFPGNDFPTGNKSRRRIASGWSITRINLPAESRLRFHQDEDDAPRTATLPEITWKFPRYPSSSLPRNRFLYFP